VHAVPPAAAERRAAARRQGREAQGGPAQGPRRRPGRQAAGRAGALGRRRRTRPAVHAVRHAGLPHPRAAPARPAALVRRTGGCGSLCGALPLDACCTGAHRLVPVRLYRAQLKGAPPRTLKSTQAQPGGDGHAVVAGRPVAAVQAHALLACFARMAVECMHEGGVSAGPGRGGERQGLTGEAACAGDAGLARGPERPEDAVQRVRRAVHEVREEALGARAALRASALQRGAEPLRGGRLGGPPGRPAGTRVKLGAGAGQGCRYEAGPTQACRVFAEMRHNRRGRARARAEYLAYISLVGAFVAGLRTC